MSGHLSRRKALMRTPIPLILSPYFEAPPAGSLTLVTSVLNATSNWLLLRAIYAALYGVNDDGGTDYAQIRELGGPREREQRRVVFVSLLRGLDLWKELGRKAGLDLSSLISNKTVYYIHGLESYDLQRLKNEVLRAIQSSYSVSSEPISVYQQQLTDSRKLNTILVIDGLDLLLASQPDATLHEHLAVLSRLQQEVHSTWLTLSADSPLVHRPVDAATPLEIAHRAFLTTVAYRSRLVMQLRCLETGVAKDITGILRASRGGSFDDEEDHLEEGEWLYHLKTDGSVRVWEK